MCIFRQQILWINLSRGLGLNKRHSRGVILITSLWIVSILSLFAVYIGRQTSISLKLVSYDLSRYKAYFIAKAGMQRALSEKAIEYKTGMSSEIDAYSQSWANNSGLFLKRSFSDGYYTIGYKYPGTLTGDRAEAMMYGLLDEQSKVNINFADINTLKELFICLDMKSDKALQMACCVMDWRDEDDIIMSSEEGSLCGAENFYYKGLSPAYECKNSNFDIIYELSLVKGFTNDIIDMLKPYITTYGNGLVNINTASEPVLRALIGPDFPSLASKIIDYRQGEDGLLGTADDAWFAIGPVIIDRGRGGLVEIKNLLEEHWYGNFYGIDTDEYNRIRELVSGTKPLICAASDIYRAFVLSEFDGIKFIAEGVYDFSDKSKPPVTRYWLQE